MIIPLALSCGGGGGGNKDRIPPILVDYRPSAGAVAVDHEIAVTLSFNETIKHASVNDKSFMLRDSSNTLVSGAYQFSDYYDQRTIVSFLPLAPLDGNEVYNVTVTTGITDTAGNHLESAAEWSFTTAPTGIGQWAPTSIVNAPDPVSSHTAVWTGSEMLVWGGTSDTSQDIVMTRPQIPGQSCPA